MSDEERWRWAYEPDADHVVAGLPEHVIERVERIAGDLVDLAEAGIDVTDIGDGPTPGAPGGVREVPLHGTDGYLYMLPLPRLRLIAMTKVIPPFADL